MNITNLFVANINLPEEDGDLGVERRLEKEKSISQCNSVLRQKIVNEKIQSNSYCVSSCCDHIRPDLCSFVILHLDFVNVHSVHFVTSRKKNKKNNKKEGLIKQILIKPHSELFSERFSFKLTFSYQEYSIN